MTDSNTFFITALVGGLVVTPGVGGSLNYNHKLDNKNQHWTIEYGDEENVVAFRNVSNGQYLRATAGGAQSAIVAGEMQWWTLTPGLGPNSFWIKCNDFPNAYLSNKGATYWDGSITSNVAMNWYFQPVNGAGSMPKPVGSSSSSEEAEGSKAREQALVEREDRLKDLEQREAALAEKEAKYKDSEQREAALAEKEARFKDLEQREAALAKKAQDFEGEETAQQKHAEQLAEKERELAQQQSASLQGDKDTSAQQAEIKRKQDEVSAAQRDLAAKTAAMEEREAQNNAREQDLKEKEAELERKQSTPELDAGTSEDTSAQQAELQRKQEEVSAAENDLATKTAAAKKQEQQNNEKEDALRRKEAEFERKRNMPQPNGGATELDRLQAINDNSKLQLLNKDLQGQLTECQNHRDDAAAASAAANDERIAKFKEENDRLKKLIAQQVRQKQNEGPQPPSKSAKSTAPSMNGTLTEGTNASGKPTGETARGAENHGLASSTNGTSSDVAVNGAITALPKAGGSKTAANMSAARRVNGTVPASIPPPRNQHSASSNSSKPRKLDRRRPEDPRPKPAEAASKSSPKPQTEAERLRAENARLKQEQAKRQAPTAAPSSSAKPGRAGLAAAASRGPGADDAGHQDDDGIHYNCGHAAYPPPRKVRRKVVGLLYE
ncbi:hypothetical protein LTR85_000466 [Meristemomyces frigidus]|nr:hypothetical protein LTR85_000466 [Meristemomyces frigidus]